MPTTSKPKVFWKKAENEQIAEYLWNAQVRPGARDLLRRARDAQLAVLPPDRQRVLTGAYSMRAVTAILLDWAKAGRPVSPPATSKAAPPESAPMPAAAATVDSGPVSTIEHGMPAAGGLLAELDQTLKALARALTARFLDHFQEELTQQAQGRLAGIISSVSPAALKVRQPKVLVLGLKPQQAGLMQQEFGTCLDLSFWKEEGSSKLMDMARSADHIIGVTSFLGHSDVGAIKDWPKYLRMGGGMTGLREALTRIYVKTTDGPEHKHTA